MKIALSTSVIQRGKSGVGQYVLSLVRAFLPSASAHEFSLYTLQEDVPLFDFARDAMRIIPVSEQFRPAVKNIFWHQKILPGLLRADGADLVHIPSYRRMLWQRPCPLVATIHDLAPFHLAAKYDPARMFYGRVVARHLAARQDRIIAVSEATAKDLAHYFQVPANRVTVIPNGIDHDVFRPGPADAARRRVCAGRGIDAPFFLYVARIEHPAKNHSGLIEAFNRYKAATGSPWKLVLGGSDWHGAEVVHRLAKESPYASDIHLLGFVPSADLADWYRAADVFVFPSLYEGFGLPPIEAMACGCPVLAAPRGAVSEVIGYSAGLLEPESPAQMATQMERAAGNAAWRAELRAAGLTRARRFDWNVAAARTLEVYSSAAAAPADAGMPALTWG